ncbi:Hsp20/alpha crystallin family protein [Halomarina halobia]|uniref:Hsp20/alpha crystallin family protein n=2 Tax=Halomarina halobia TaxID=3033386 RepID=A0ABD6A3W6_9EURY
MNRRTPFEEMERVFDQMRHSMLGTWDLSVPTPDRRWPSGATAGANVSIETDDDGYVVHADLPGFERDELELTFDDGVLTLSGDHEVADETSARRRNVFEQVTIPGDVLAEEVTASYRNGVLEVRLPTADAGDDAHRIDIE